ncbi:hypothetical protein [Paenibacillus campi]|uniref:hypothetical protein n=1 Tax=Paenibacillus campi TaxID=3106031 RepID=UPI002AFF6DA2|nr:hypothetical protein [Paenibacillus sp. SGZ-1014]
MSGVFADEECKRLFWQSRALPNGTAKLELLEQAVRIADALGDVQGAYMIREDLVEAAVFSGFALKGITHFSWQLGQFDIHPALYNERELLWSYKWIISNSMHFPQISRQQLMELLADMRDRYMRAGYSERTYYSNLFTLHMHTGEFEQADEYYAIVKKMKRENISDCRAYDQNEIVEYFARTGRYKEALKAAKPIVDGKMRCTEIPHLTLAELLMPSYQLGEHGQAADYQHQNYPMLRNNRDFLRSIGLHIAYLAHADPFKGLELYEQHATWSLDSESPLDRMYFHASAAGLFQVLSQETVAFNVRLPDGYPYGDDRHHMSSLSHHLQAMALELAEQFDRRNGTAYYVDAMRKLSAAQTV